MPVLHEAMTKREFAIATGPVRYSDRQATNFDCGKAKNLCLILIRGI